VHLGLVGAFPFPYPQGSQVFVGQQAAALRHAGARVSILSYGTGQGVAPEGVAHHRVARAISPAGLRSGPQWGKPLADAALAALILRVHHSTPFDALLCHNAEAALAGLAARPLARVPVVYVAHTLLRHELAAYGPARAAPALDRAGAGIDRFLARRCDAVVALCAGARDALARSSRGPVEVIPPGLEKRPAPEPARLGAACGAHGLERGRFFLYAGNLDRYQDLALLAEAAAERREGAWPVVVATHDAGPASERHPGLRYVEVEDFAELRELTFAAGGLVMTRRRPGGFPIKLLNYMEAGRPIVAWERIAPGLVDGRSARLLGDGAGAGALCEALGALEARPDAAAALGRAARDTLERDHAWPAIARRTLGLAGRLVSRAPAPPRTRAQARG